MITRRSIPLLALLACVFAAPSAHASFHLMQIEQVIGGVNGDVGAQAIQLRMRGGGQNLVSQGRIRAWDAAGLNPVLIIDIAANVPNGVAGDRVLIATPAFHTSPAVAPDFPMTNPIPASYLAAGSLTFEADGGLVYWRLSWGGAGYTGPGTVSINNDGDGNANPPFALGLPKTTLQALKFNGIASAPSVTNAADYSVTSGASVWTNNARASGTLIDVTGVGEPPHGSGVQLGAPSPNPVSGLFSYSVTLPRAGHARVTAYSVSGRMVQTLIDRDLPAGQRVFTWDPRSGSDSRLSSGVYYLRLESEGVRRSQKFIVIR